MLRHLINYAGVHILSRLLPLAGVFIFSVLLDPTDVGIISLHLATVWLLATLLSCNLYAGVGRLLFDPSVETDRMLGVAFIAMSASALTFGTIWILASEYIGRLLFLPPVVVIFQIPVALGLIAESTLTQMMIYQKRSGLLLRIMAYKSVTLLCTAIVGILLLKENRFYGVIFPDALAGLLMLLTVIWIARPVTTVAFDPSSLNRLIRYSVPLIFHGLSLALLSQIDRVLIANFLGTAAVGIYTLSYTIGASVLLASVPIMNAFQTRFFMAMNTGDSEGMSADSNGLMTSLTLFAAIIICLAPSVSLLLFPATYSSGFHLIPLVAIGALLQVHFLIWTRVLAFHEHTMLISAIVMVAAGLNIILNMSLIPNVGLTGAALSTVIAQMFMATALQTCLYILDLPRQRLLPHMFLLIGSIVLWVIYSRLASLIFIHWAQILVLLAIGGISASKVTVWMRRTKLASRK